MPAIENGHIPDLVQDIFKGKNGGLNLLFQKIFYVIKLRMEMGNVPKRQQPDHRKYYVAICITTFESK